jgi:regulator of sirC expression with transglutaminase-like and TPR domain
LLQVHPNGSDLDEKQQFEDEAVESDFDFIDDDDPDESSEDVGQQVREAAAALRNRRSWQSMRAPCPTCGDLRAILRHLLGGE